MKRKGVAVVGMSVGVACGLLLFYDYTSLESVTSRIPVLQVNPSIRDLWQMRQSVETNPATKNTAVLHAPPHTTLALGGTHPRPRASQDIQLQPGKSQDTRLEPRELQPGESHLPYGEDEVMKITEPGWSIFREPGPPDPNGPPFKKILFWNDAYSNKHFGFGAGREPFLRAKCPVNTCYATANRSLFPMSEIDAVIWHWRSSDKSLPKKRWPHTRYVFWMMESASHMYGDISPFRNTFNWTFTYRLDSDFLFPYAQVYRRRHPLPEQQRNYAQGKTKMAAWFVSNCNTIGGREQLVGQLRRWIKVDQYGACGTLKCGRDKDAVCNAMLSRDYKFYLSFENSLCKDYVTEKFFNMLRLDVLPVVYGLGNYSVMAPPHSYVDALSFPTARALADYLIYLSHNDTAYNEYFAWKRFHVIPTDWVRKSRPFCQMCERLHKDNSTHIYNIKNWFVRDSHCMSKQHPRIKSFIGKGY